MHLQIWSSPIYIYDKVSEAINTLVSRGSFYKQFRKTFVYTISDVKPSGEHEFEVKNANFSCPGGQNYVLMRRFSRFWSSFFLHYAKTK